jgi:hypothetical protein
VIYIVFTQDTNEAETDWSMSEYSADDEQEALEMAIADGYGHDGKPAWIFPRNAGVRFDLTLPRKLTYQRTALHE